MKLIIYLCSFLLVSCAMTPPKTLPWRSRELRLQQIKSWRITGKISITAHQKTQFANFTWHQNHDTYQIKLSGPLNLHPIQITNDDPNALSYQQLGGHHLIYWLRGLPAPIPIKQQQFDSSNHLSIIEQQAWQIVYKNYTPIGNLELPTTLTVSQLVGDHLKLKIVITSWQLN